MSKYASRRWPAAVAFLAVLTFVSAAFAQDIRRYGDDEGGGESGGGGNIEGETRMFYPGQPVPQNDSGQQNQQQAAQQEKAGESGEGGESGDMEASYEVRIYKTAAQEEDEREAMRKKAPKELYNGIIPGTRDVVEHLDEEIKRREAEGGSLLTWLGFQAEEDKTRIFLQTSKKPRYNVDRQDDGKTIILTLESTDFSARNFQREIDASYFTRNPSMITATSGDGDIEIRIELRESESPKVTAEGKYLYLDFSAGVEAESTDQKS